MEVIKKPIEEKLQLIAKEAEEMVMLGVFSRCHVENAFSSALGRRYYFPLLQKILHGKCQISKLKFEKLCSSLNVRNEFIKKGIGHPFFKMEANLFLSESPNFEISKPAQLSVAATPSATSTEYKRLDPVFNDEIDFVVYGRSMEPEFQQEDIVKCKFVGSYDELKEGETYVFSIKGYEDMMLKKVEMKRDIKKRVLKIVLISLNEKYKPLTLGVNEIEQIYKVKCLQRIF